MPRSLTIGNGSMLINFDERYRLRDLYYPNVGADNHLAERPSRLGVWCSGHFAWLDAEGWELHMAYEHDNLVTDVQAFHPYLNVRLHVADCVDFNRDILVRRFQVENLAERPREVRLFFHYDWQLWGTYVGDTVFYHPATRSLVAYKGRRFFLVNALCGEQVGLTDWATGVYFAESAHGSWQDAEDGWLSQNGVSRGAVDCVGAISLGQVEPGTAKVVYHWLIAGTSLPAVLEDDRQIRSRTPEGLIVRTRAYWAFWVHKHRQSQLDLPAELWDLYHRSLLILRTQIDENGAIIAGNDPEVARVTGDTYSYMLPRVGAITAVALDRAGYTDLTRRFYEFCATLPSREGYLFPKYTPFGALGSLAHPWLDPEGEERLPIAEDSTALLLWGLSEHFRHERDIDFVRPLYQDCVRPALEFLLRHRDEATKLPRPSYDLWDETYGIHAFTVAATWAALRGASVFTTAFGQPELTTAALQAADDLRTALDRYMYDGGTRRFVTRVRLNGGRAPVPVTTVDASLAGLFLFGMVAPDDERMVRTMEAVRKRLWCHTEVAGIARYENDPFLQISQDKGNIPGNPWIVCTMWLCQWCIARARTAEELKEAVELLAWAHRHALPSGILPEQVHPYTHAPLSVAPLTWSHAEFVLAVHAYLQQRQWLAGGTRATLTAGITGSS